MIRIVPAGSLFEMDDVDAQVNTINCVGAMGAGIALEFKNRYPVMYEEYRKACQAGKIKTGQMWVFSPADRYEGQKPQYIINFPTKQHWKNPSELKWIKEGMIHLIYAIGKLNIKSIAIPALGCSNGGLKWDEVRPIMTAMLKPISEECDIFIFPPLQKGN